MKVSVWYGQVLCTVNPTLPASCVRAVGVCIRPTTPQLL